MPWWTEKHLHPKTKGRFFVTFSNNFFLPNVKSTSKPSMTVDMKEYQLINHQFKYPGIVKWNDVTIKFVDMNGNANAFDTADLLWQMLNNTGYAYPYLNLSQIRLPHYTKNVDDTGRGGGGHHIATTRNDFRTITTPEKSSTLANSFGRGLTGKADFDGSGVFKQRVAIYQISPGGKLTECWYLANPQIKSINFGDLAYESDELVEYEMVVSYDWAILDSTLTGTDATQITQAGQNAYEEFREAAKNRKDKFRKAMEKTPAEREVSRFTSGLSFESPGGAQDSVLSAFDDFDPPNAQQGTGGLSGAGTFDGSGDVTALGGLGPERPRRRSNEQSRELIINKKR